MTTEPTRQQVEKEAWAEIRADLDQWERDTIQAWVDANPEDAEALGVTPSRPAPPPPPQPEDIVKTVIAMRPDGAALIRTRDDWGVVLAPDGLTITQEMPLGSFLKLGYWGDVPVETDVVAIMAQALSALGPPDQVVSPL